MCHAPPKGWMNYWSRGINSQLLWVIRGKWSGVPAGNHCCWQFAHYMARLLHVTSKMNAVSSTAKRKSLRNKVQAHRARLREKGLRPIQIWVPDVRSAAFRSQAHKQSLAVARSSHADADQVFLDAISELGDV
jgi:Protein  of unknown function (DUF3018)